jgi:hypothetical protein
MLIEIFMLTHYLAPFTAAFYVIELQAMRHLRVWRLGGQPVGTQMVRVILVACVAMAVLRTWAEPLHLGLAGGRSNAWTTFSWYGPGQLQTRRATVENDLEKLPGKQLAIVRYSPDHDSAFDWVYNAADIDNSKVIWAREMDVADNLELIHYYKDRKVWLVQPDTDPANVSAYPLPE